MGCGDGGVGRAFGDWDELMARFVELRRGHKFHGYVQARLLALFAGLKSVQGQRKETSTVPGGRLMFW